ncbi:MAG: universal stress protein [Planctomycetaceae bacterium]|nr:universal stress protein [Planctomycetaceae bacterium]
MMIQLQKLLVPTDFSEFSNHALRYGCEFAKRFGAQLHLLHVMDASLTMPDPIMGAPVSDAELNDLQNRAATAIEDLPESDWLIGIDHVKRVIQIGSPFVEIIRYAKQQEIDMIVLGTHGRTGLAHVLIGSTAERVIRKAPCPVLTVRPEEHDFVMP